MNKLEELFQQSIRKDFTTIDSETSVERAMEILHNENLTTLVIEYYDENSQKFYKIVTGKEIANCFAKGYAPNKTVIDEIAISSDVIEYDQYLDKVNDVLTNADNIYLIQRNGEIIGVATSEGILAVVNSNGIPLDKLTKSSNGSILEKFINSHEDPIADIADFYELLTAKGFTLDSNLKGYLKARMKEELDRQLQYENGMALLEHAEPEQPAPSVESGGIQLAKLESQKIAIIYNHKHIRHKSAIPSPENPERLLNIINLLKREQVNVFNKDCKLVSEFEAAKPQDILRVHTRKYLDFVKSYSKKGGGFLGDSTYFTPFTYSSALLAAGGALKAGDVVLKDGYEFSLALIRPPGHHATADKYGGYCIFNNSAVLARFLQRKRKLSKIMILDWDAHSANGTMQIFYDDPTVLVISIHQDPHGFYPNTGFMEQLGRGDGLGYNINIEMPKDSGDNEYTLVFKEIVLPLFNSFKPDFIIGCNGFDAHYKDTYTNLKLTSKGYYRISRTLGKITRNKLAILNEGGYHSFNGELTHTIINGLLGLPNPFQEKYDSLTVSVTSSEKIRKILGEKLVLLRKLLLEFHDI